MNHPPASTPYHGPPASTPYHGPPASSDSDAHRISLGAASRLPLRFSAENRRTSATIQQFNTYKEQHLRHEQLQQQMRQNSGSIGGGSGGKGVGSVGGKMMGMSGMEDKDDREHDPSTKLQIHLARITMILNRWFRYVLQSLMVWPVLSLLINFIIGSLLARIEIRPSGSYNDKTSFNEFTVFFNGSASEASSIFIYVGGLVISITGVLFSLSIVAFQVAGVSYSPRLLEGLTRRMGTKVVLSVFLGTFSYSYSALYSVKDTIGQGENTEGGAYYVPVFAVNFLIFYVIISVIALIYYLDFVVKSLAVSTLLDEVKSDLLKVINNICPKVNPEETLRELEAQTEGDHNHVDFDIDKLVRLPIVPANDAYVVYPSSSGYLIHVNENFLVHIAKARHLNVRFRPKPGEYLTTTTPLGWVWRSREISDENGKLKYPRKLNAAELALVRNEINYCIELGKRRSIPPQDLAFGFKQMTDIALKALSPGINDPTTACETIDRCEQIFCEMARRHLEHHIIALPPPQKGVVALPRPTFSGLLDATVHPIRQYGAGDVCTARRLLYMLGAVGTSFSKEREFMRLRVECVENLIECVLISCSRIFEEDSPEMDAVIFAAEHAYFLMYGGRNDEVHRYAESSMSDDDAAKQENDEPEFDEDGNVVINQSREQEIETSDRTGSDTEPVVFEDIKDREAVENPTDDDDITDDDTKGKKKDEKGSDEVSLKLKNLNSSDNNPDISTFNEENSEPVLSMGSIPLLNENEKVEKEQMVDEAKPEQDDKVDSTLIRSLSEPPKHKDSQSLHARKEFIFNLQKSRASDEKKQIQDNKKSTSGSISSSTSNSSTNNEDEAPKAKKSEKRLRKGKLMEKYKKWKNEREEDTKEDSKPDSIQAKQDASSSSIVAIVEGDERGKAERVIKARGGDSSEDREEEGEKDVESEGGSC